MTSLIRDVAKIVQTVSFAGSTDEQVNLIVESISNAMQVEVCSLYLENDNHDMELFASKGLAKAGTLLGSAFTPEVVERAGFTLCEEESWEGRAWCRLEGAAPGEYEVRMSGVETDAFRLRVSEGSG